MARTSLSLSFCTCSTELPDSNSLETPFCKPDFHSTRPSPLGSSFRSLSCKRFPSVKMGPGLCMGPPETSPCLVSRSSSLRRSTSNDGRRWLCSFNHSMDWLSLGLIFFFPTWWAVHIFFKEIILEMLLLHWLDIAWVNKCNLPLFVEMRSLKDEISYFCGLECQNWLMVYFF